MYIPLFWIVTSWVVVTKADLVCLGWDLISPTVGLLCHFQSETSHSGEKATVAAVGAAVESAKDVVKFDLTHNPATVTYNFFSATSQGGIRQGGQVIADAAKDYEGVTIGFAKESANQLVQLYDLTHWNDVSNCLITGAARLASQALVTARKRAGVPSTDKALVMAHSCISDKFKQISKPALFNITDPNQKVGSTISDVAALLVPVGAEGESTAGVAQKAVDLVIPGSEDTTRVLKKVDDGLTAQHFTSEAEAQAVAENMQDPQWVKENCGACAPIIVSSQYYRRSTNHINRRGNSFSSCCKAPATLLESAVDLDTTADGGGLAYETSSEGEQDLDDQLHDPIYDPENYNTIVETDLVQAPQYKLRDVSIANDLQGLQQDLDGMSTGLIPWSAPLQAVTSSDEVFATLRRVFTSETDPLYKLLDIEEREGKFRLISFSQSWISKIDPALKPLQDFVNAAVQQAIDTVAKLQKLSAADTANLRGSIEFFYVAPSEKALTGVDPRGFHIDAGMMQFGAADTPGLIVRNTATGTASRVPVVKNTFQLVKARNWDMEAYLQDLPNGPTWHSVFGPEMSRNGRVSMVMSVFVTGTYI